MRTTNTQTKITQFLIFQILIFILFTCLPVVNAGKNSTIETQGDITTHYGLSEEAIQKILGNYSEMLKKEFNFTENAIRQFFTILKEKEVPPSQLQDRLEQIAQEYSELRNKLEGFQSDDPDTAKLKHQAKEALDQGDFDQAEKQLNEAKKREVKAANQHKTAGSGHFMSAAASAAENGALKDIRLDDEGAAGYYKEAAHLAEKTAHPMDQKNELILADYLHEWSSACYSAGNYKEAEPPLKRALMIREKLLGKENADVAIAINNLAELYRCRERYEEAEPLYKRSLAIMEKMPETEHSKRVTPLGNLALLYEAQGRYDEAESHYKQFLENIEKTPGAAYSELIPILNRLALLYDSQGRYEEAEHLYRRSLEITEKTLGPEHPGVAGGLGNLATLYQVQGRYEEAERMCRRSLDI